MKGIAHFVTGIAVATLFPGIVEGAADGSLLLVLGGVAALLPDTLDFKVIRYLERYDVEIDPGPEPDPCQVAEVLTRIARETYQTGEPRSVMLHTVRLGPDRWRRYLIHLRPDAGELSVAVGPVVDTSQRPQPVSGIDAASCSIPLGVPVDPRCKREIVVDIFSGPSLTFRLRGDRVHIGFLDWHRRWSHSLTLAAALGSGTAGLTALCSLLADQPARAFAPRLTGLVVGLGLLAHILQDQLGHMGSNLLFPITRSRTRGLGLIHSGDAVPNVLTVWGALMLILFNLDRFSTQPQLPPWWAFFGLAFLLPAVTLVAAHVRDRPHGSEPGDGEWQEINAELEDMAVG